MKYDLKTTLIILGLFFLAQITGLIIVNKNFEIWGQEFFENEETVSDALVSLPVSIIVLSIVFILLYKLKLRKLLIYWYGFAFITTITISLSAFINEFYALFIAISLFLLKTNSTDDYLHNLCELLVYGGIVVIILPLLNIFSTIILLIIISVYDFIAVRLSKHMISLAKTQFELNIFSGLKVSSNEMTAVLGGGDIAFPLILASVMFRDLSILSAILVVYGALIGLTTLILIGKENKFYPAMPFITSGCFIGLIINYLFI